MSFIQSEKKFYPLPWTALFRSLAHCSLSFRFLLYVLYFMCLTFQKLTDGSIARNSCSCQKYECWRHGLVSRCRSSEGRRGLLLFRFSPPRDWAVLLHTTAPVSPTVVSIFDFCFYNVYPRHNSSSFRVNDRYHMNRFESGPLLSLLMIDTYHSRYSAILWKKKKQ